MLQRGQRCADSLQSRKAAQALGLPPHPAMYPTAIPEFAIKFLTEEGDLVVDPFGGSGKTGLAAERLNRRWLISDLVLEYVRTQAELFSSMPGFWLNPTMREVA